MLAVDRIDIAILCGGLGERLRSVVGATPKVMAAIGGRPFLDLLLEHLAAQKFRRVILLTDYKSDIIEDYYRKKNFPFAVEFSRESKSLGTGGAVQNAAPLIKSDPFFAMNGDSFCPVDFAAFLDFHHAKKAWASLVLSKVNDPRDFGTITLDQYRRLTGFLEKNSGKNSPGNSGPEPAYVNSGIYCFPQEFFRSRDPHRGHGGPGVPFSAPQEKFSLELDFFPWAVPSRKLYGFVIEEKFTDIGTPERYKNAKQKLAK